MQLNAFDTRPKPPQIDIKGYLERIGARRQYHPSLPFLRDIHRHHLYTVPFENLDVAHKRKIILDVHKTYNKVVLCKRGGFCYELNGLFFHLLAQLGFDCYMIGARVFRDDGSLGPPLDHAAVLVRLRGEEWLVDVGFGDSFLSPKRIVPYEVQVDYNRYFKLETDPDDNYILMMSDDGVDYSPKYWFSTQRKEYIEFLEMCEYHQTSPDSPFTRKKMITQATKSGRITLTDRRLKLTQLGEVNEIHLLNNDEFYSKLEQHFGITKQMLSKSSTL